jgi:uncharacterized RDD family membrane protein YckC
MTSGGQLPPPQPPGPWAGGQFPPSPNLPPPPPAYPSGYYAGAPHAGPAPGLGYAGFWIRFVAALIDGIILGVPLAVIFLVADGSTLKAYTDCLNNAIATGSYAGTCSTTLTGSIAPYELIGLGVEFLYFVGLWSQLGGTLGQRMLGLHVVDAATGKHIGIGRAIGRFIGYVISSFVLFIGLIWAAFDPRKQGWHDKIASTFVVRKV